MTKISTLIFDLGGVILNIDADKTLRAFKRLGIDLEELNASSSVFTDYETGKITTDQFRLTLQTALHGRVAADLVDEAWNAMILDLPAERLTILEKLKKKYKIVLLSNTNELHINYFYAYLNKTHGLNNWVNLFDKIFYSHEIGQRKPHASCYEYVCKQLNTAPEQCVFIDDSKINTRGAESVGIRTVWTTQPLGPELLSQLKATLTSGYPQFN